MLTNQEIFDKVARHLLTQNDRAMSVAAGGCAYRTDAGQTCAVGCLIPAEAYDPRFEGVAAGSVASPEREEDAQALADVLLEAGVDSLGESRQLLRTLQMVHDGTPVEEWKDELRVVAVKNGLRGNVLDL